MHGLETEYFPAIEFVYLDVDDPATEPFREQLGRTYQPEYHLLDGDGNVVEVFKGRVNADEMRASFDALLAQ